MGLTKLAIRLAAPVPHPEKFESYLFVGPHPDDIEIGAGATIARLAEEGKKITFLICTDGRYGDGHLPKGTSPDEVAGIRREECIASAAHLGVTDVRFLELSDGGFYKKKDLLSAIAEVVGEVQPDILFAPDPWVKSESHPDHLNVGKVVRRIACVAPYHGIMEQYGAKAAPVQAVAYYMTAQPNRFVRTGSAFRKQLEAIAGCHVSQFPTGEGVDSSDWNTLKLYLTLRSVEYGIRVGSLHGEAFRVLGTTHMHCLPEA